MYVYIYTGCYKDKKCVNVLRAPICESRAASCPEVQRKDRLQPILKEHVMFCPAGSMQLNNNMFGQFFLTLTQMQNTNNFLIKH